MSFWARQAQREHIQQIITLIDSYIRPDLQRAITEATSRTAEAPGPDSSPPHQAQTTRRATEAQVPDGACRNGGDQYPDSADPGSELKANSGIMPTPREPYVKRPVFSSLNAFSNTIIPLPPTGLDQPLSEMASTGLDQGSPPSSSRPSPPIGSHTYTTSSNPLVATLSANEPWRNVSIDRSPLARIAKALRHLRSGSSLPKGIFRGATSDDLLVLETLYQALTRMIQGIDKTVADIVNTASQRFDEHMASSGQETAPVKKLRCFKDQEEWQVNGAKKTRWNPNADWGSEMVFSEVEAKPQEPAMRGPGSRLRQTYVPDEWSWSASESPFWETEVSDNW